MHISPGEGNTQVPQPQVGGAPQVPMDSAPPNSLLEGRASNLQLLCLSGPVSTEIGRLLVEERRSVDSLGLKRP